MAADITPQDNYLDADGLRLHYPDWGHDPTPPMLLLHAPPSPAKGGRGLDLPWSAPRGGGERWPTERSSRLMPPAPAAMWVMLRPWGDGIGSQTASQNGDVYPHIG